MTVHVWTVLVALIGIFEGWALFDKKPRNTWSAWFYTHVRAYLGVRLVAYPLLTWTWAHWILSPTGTFGAVDVSAIAAGVVLAFVATTRRPENPR